MPFTYIEQEFKALFEGCTVPYFEINRGEITMQVCTQWGKTKWLSITPEQCLEIETILNANYG